MFRKKTVSLFLFLFMVQSILLFTVSSPVLAGVGGYDPCNYSIGTGGKVQFVFSYSSDYNGTRPTIIVTGPASGSYPSSAIDSQFVYSAGSYQFTGIAVLPGEGYAIQEVTVDGASQGAAASTDIPSTAGIYYADFTVTFAAAPPSSSASSSSSASTSAAASSSKTSSAPASSSAAPSSAAHSSDAASASSQTVSGSASDILSAVSPSALSSSQSSSLSAFDRSVPGSSDIAESVAPKDNCWFIWLGAFFLLLMLLLLFFFLWKRRKKKKDEQPTDSQKSAETKPGEKLAPEKEDVTKDSRP